MTTPDDVPANDRLVVPSTLLKKLAAPPKTNTLSRALREIQISEHINLTGIYDWMGEPQPIGLTKPQF